MREEIYRYRSAHQSKAMENKLDLTLEVLVERLHQEGIELGIISRITELSESEITAILEKARISKIPITAEEQDLMIDYWREELSPTAIAVKMKLSVTRVQSKLRELVLID